MQINKAALDTLSGYISGHRRQAREKISEKYKLNSNVMVVKLLFSWFNFADSDSGHTAACIPDELCSFVSIEENARVICVAQFFLHHDEKIIAVNLE